MNKAGVTKVLKSIENCKEEFSLGFKRFHFLPQRVRMNVMKAHLLETGETNYLPRAKAFLAGLTDVEFQNWLKMA